MEGHNENIKRSDILWAKGILYNGKFKDSVKVSDILGYDPYGDGDKEEMIKETPEQRKKRIDIELPPLSPIELMKLKRKIKEGKGK